MLVYQHRWLYAYGIKKGIYIHMAKLDHNAPQKTQILSHFIKQEDEDRNICSVMKYVCQKKVILAFHKRNVSHHRYQTNLMFCSGVIFV